MHQKLRTEEFCAVVLKSPAELEVTPVSWLWLLVVACGLAFLSSLPFGTVVTVIADFRGEEVLERYHVSIIGSTSTICFLSELFGKVSLTSAP